MKRYAINITGTHPLLMHASSVDWADQVQRWQKDPENKKLGVPGDDRSPAWTWIGKMYNDGGVVGS